MNKDSIDKGVNKGLSVLLLGHIQLAEAVEPETHKFFTDLWLLQFFKRNAILKFLFGSFQFFKECLGRFREDTLCNGF